MIEGLDHLIVRLDGFTDQNKLDLALLKGAYLVENKAKMKSPVYTGRLRASLTHRKSDINEYTVGTNVEYAPYVENGTGIYSINGRKEVPWRYKTAEGWFTTSGQRPQPFLYPALNESRKEITRIIKETISK